MSMYTELNMHVALKKDVPRTIVDILNYMLSNTSLYEENVPNHDFFDTSHWEYMLRSDSYYFHATTHSTLRWDDIANNYFLDIQCNFRNYEDEVTLFLDWLNPYIDENEGAFIGYYRTEIENKPMLLYKL